MHEKTNTPNRTLTEDDLEALATKLKDTGCLVFSEEERTKLKAFTDHTTTEGAEAAGKIGVIMAGEQRFYSRLMFRAVGLLIIGVLIWIFGNRICTAIFGKAIVELWR